MGHLRLGALSFIEAAPQTIVLVPLRSFNDAKSRLAAALGPADRERLTQAMAERVVRAAHDLAVYVVTDDDSVARWAGSVDAQLVRPEALGLNESVTAALEIVRGSKPFVERVIIAHADLPWANDLRVVTGPGVAIAPDRTRDGSNVMSVPIAVDFTFRYGPGSFARHREEATRHGLEFTVVADPSLALDIDEPADLLLLEP